MPGLAQRNEQFSNGSLQSYSLSSANGFWSKHRDDISYNQLRKFWNELAPRARQELLRIDKQTLFEQARKNMYCSRCNGLLLEGFLQIVMYGKSLQQDGASGQLPRALRNQEDGESNIVNGCQDEIQHPSVHPWGGLTTTRDGSLTLMDCYSYSKSLKGLQNVFDSARARERERELLYPDACGGGGRGWISQGIVGYGRGHGTRETCALHTARLSCDTLVDFWSALGEETRQSLLRMKEEDFIERLMYRFDSKRFCRDCRRNVIREFKELKELKRMRREPRCTSWFCVADTAFQYEVSDDTVYADWHNTFADAAGTYHHFEWAVGTGEGKADILEFENVGMNGSVTVDGLDLGGLSACFITLRAWKLDGRCTELSVKAHALKGGQCVHCRLVVGDGFVSITRGESIRRFFEHAEEAEEEEDDDSMDKDGNDLDGECSRPQKHAKSPELAREFLLDAATVIFKEQVEKAFREGTARQNAHSIFVCLALKLLEERVHVACKEIITLEKQMKLLEEEEKEKREEEERKERRRMKEREKKLRRKERLKGKEKDKDKVKHSCEPNQNPDLPAPEKESSLVVDEEAKNSISFSNSVGETGNYVPTRPASQNTSHDCHDGETKDGNGSATVEITKYSRRRSKVVQLDLFMKWSERRRNAVAAENAALQNRSEIRCLDDGDASPKAVNSTNRQLRVNGTKANGRCGLKFGEKFQCSNSGRINDRYDYSCSCNQNTEYRPKVEQHVSAVRVGQETKSGNKSESALDVPRQLYPGIRFNQTDQTRDSCGRPKSKFVLSNPSARDLPHSKKVWEPLESTKKYARSNSESGVTESFSLKVDGSELNNSLIKPSEVLCSGKTSVSSCKTDDDDDDDNDSKESMNSTSESDLAAQNGIHLEENDCFSSKEEHEKDGARTDHSSVNFINSKSDGISEPIVSISSSSDNCSSCLSDEGDSNTASSNLGNNDSSSTSDSEDSSLQSEGKETPDPIQNGVSECHEVRMEKIKSPIRVEPLGGRASAGVPQNGVGSTGFGISPANIGHAFDNSFPAVNMGSQHQSLISPLHNQNLPFPVFQAPSPLGYYNQSPVSWPPAAPNNGLLSFSHPNQYLYTGPLGYGMSGDSHFCMQYNHVQHLATPPLYTPAPLPPFYQPITKASPVSLDEQPWMSKPLAPHESPSVAAEESTDRIGPRPTRAAAASSGGDGVQSDDPGKSHAGDTSFSLFHFGGPVGLSAGCQPNPLPLKEEIVGDFSSKCPAERDNGCHKKASAVEEYNLFAASNGIRFSFF